MVSRRNLPRQWKLRSSEDKEIMGGGLFSCGTEYRFFVLGEETLAVLLRVPANVVGGGIHAVAELVKQKPHHCVVMLVVRH